MSVNVLLVGPGLVGSALLGQIEREQGNLAKKAIDLKLIGVANSRRFALSKEGLNAGEWKKALEAGKDGNLLEFVSEAAGFGLRNTVLVDCTAADGLAPAYQLALESNIHIVAANKKVASGPLDVFKKMRDLASQPAGPRYLYEANVGAGLPIIGTLTDFTITGDKVLEISGIFSGTLAFLFNTLAEGKSFSSVLKQAKELGYTEPDPRDDLSFMDVARKVTILARTAGFDVELSDVKIDPLLPKSCVEAPSVDKFFEVLATDFDAEIEKRRAKAEQEDKRLRVLGSFNPASTPKMTVSLVEVKVGEAAATVKGSENVCAFVTERYNTYPCVVKGPGAGAEVTAAGVFADILKVRDCNVVAKK